MPKGNAPTRSGTTLALPNIVRYFARWAQCIVEGGNGTTNYHIIRVSHPLLERIVAAPKCGCRSRTAAAEASPAAVASSSASSLSIFVKWRFSFPPFAPFFFCSRRPCTTGLEFDHSKCSVFWSFLCFTPNTNLCFCLCVHLPSPVPDLWRGGPVRRKCCRVQHQECQQQLHGEWEPAGWIGGF